jgi:hypothetical protein
MNLEEMKEIIKEVGNYCDCSEDYYCYYCYCRVKLKNIKEKTGNGNN